jgi:multiple sugar transport system permease protein
MKKSILVNPYVLIAPGFLLAGFIILWPLWELGNIATADVNRFGQLRGFVGFDNFLKALIADAGFHFASLWRTALLDCSGGRSSRFIVCGLPLALILNEDFYGRGVARVILMLPWAVSLTMTASRLALGAQRRERHAQFRAARA